MYKKEVMQDVPRKDDFICNLYLGIYFDDLKVDNNTMDKRLYEIVTETMQMPCTDAYVAWLRYILIRKVKYHKWRVCENSTLIETQRGFNEQLKHFRRLDANSKRYVKLYDTVTKTYFENYKEFAALHYKESKQKTVQIIDHYNTYKNSFAPLKDTVGYMLDDVDVTVNWESNDNKTIIRKCTTEGKDENSAFTAVSLQQQKGDYAVIHVIQHKYEMKQIELQGGKDRMFIKDSLAIRLIKNLYSRGVHITVVNHSCYNTSHQSYKKTKTIITPEDNVYKKIDELCGVDSKPNYRLGKEFKQTDYQQILESINPEEFEKYEIPVPTEREVKLFNRFAGVYGLDSSKSEDLLSFMYFMHRPKFAGDFMEGNSFRCPCCGNLVRVNGHEEFIKGNLINTNETICDYCGKEFNIHDKRDILQMLNLPYEEDSYTITIK